VSTTGTSVVTVIASEIEPTFSVTGVQVLLSQQRDFDLSLEKPVASTVIL
jgi:hypothetical protein